MDLLVCGICVYMQQCTHKFIFFSPLSFFFQRFVLCLFFRFHLHDATLKKSSPSPPKQALGLCWAIRENGVQMVCRVAGFFSSPLLFFFGRHPWQVVTSAWSEGVLSTESTMTGGFGANGSPLCPTSPAFHHHLKVIPIGYFPEAMSETKGGSKFLGLEAAAASPSRAMGFMQLWAASSALQKVCFRGWRWPRCWGVSDLAPSFEGGQRKPGINSKLVKGK